MAQGKEVIPSTNPAIQNYEFLLTKQYWDQDNPDVDIAHRGKKKKLSKQQLKLLPRRQADEPIIGHLKADHRMDRCHLKGSLGDSLHAVLCAAGYNIRWLLRMIVKKGLRPFLRLFFFILFLIKNRINYPIPSDNTLHPIGA